MTKVLSRRLSRRNLLLSGAGLAASGAIIGASAAVLGARATENVELQPKSLEADFRGPRPIEVMQHDEVQEEAAFARGDLRGAELRDGRLRGVGVFISEVIAAPFPFTHAVLKWGGRTAGAAFEFRTSPDGLTWPDWRTSDVEAASVEASDAEALSGLLEAPRHGFLQYKVRLRAGAEIGQVTAFFLNSKDGPTVDVPVVRGR